jgi:hypothetical protein
VEPTETINIRQKMCRKIPIYTFRQKVIRFKYLNKISHVTGIHRKNYSLKKYAKITQANIEGRDARVSFSKWTLVYKLANRMNICFSRQSTS